MSEHGSRRESAATGHASPLEVAAYLDGGASAEERDRLEVHLSECSECCEELVAVAKLRSKSGRPGRFWLAGGAIAAAAAAVVLLVGSPGTRMELGEADTPVPVQRTTPAAATGIEALTPPEGGAVWAERLLFAWRSAGSGSPLYRLAVVTEQGDSVWAVTTRDTSIAPSEARLDPGRTYLWYVDALLPGGRVRTSGIRHFRVER